MTINIPHSINFPPKPHLPNSLTITSDHTTKPPRPSPPKMSRPTLESLQSLYKQHLSTASLFSSYNYRRYFVRKAEETFAPVLKSSGNGGQESVDAKWLEAREKELEVLKRSAEINRTFQGPTLVVEHAMPITCEPFEPYSCPNLMGKKRVRKLNLIGSGAMFF